MVVWLITGTSSGFGREIALAALARGDKVVAAARKTSSVQDLADKGAFPLALDVTAPEADIKAAIATAIEKFGTIDVLVNNAGQSIVGTVEELRYVIFPAHCAAKRVVRRRLGWANWELDAVSRNFETCSTSISSDILTSRVRCFLT